MWWRWTGLLCTSYAILLALGACEAFPNNDATGPEVQQGRGPKRDAGSQRDAGDDRGSAGHGQDAAAGAEPSDSGAPRPISAHDAGPTPTLPDAATTPPIVDAGAIGPGSTAPPPTCASIIAVRVATSCDFLIDKPLVPGRECQAVVKINGQALSCNDPNGWVLSSPQVIQLRGVSCQVAMRADAVQLQVLIPCRGAL